MIRNFQSVEELVSAFKTLQSQGAYVPFLDQRVDETVRKALEGDAALVPEAEKLMNLLESSVPETLQPTWRSDVYGPVLSVPDYLTGIPTPFRRMHEAESESAPIKIFVGMMSSAGISARDLKTRGVTIAALVMKLQVIRPVDIVMFTEWGFDDISGTYNIMCPLESRPLSLAHLVNVLADAYFFRQFMHTIAFKDGVRRGGPWPINYTSKEYSAQRAKTLSATSNDLVIPSTYTGDEIIRNPVKWINDNLTKLAVLEPEA